MHTETCKDFPLATNTANLFALDLILKKNHLCGLSDVFLGVPLEAAECPVRLLPYPTRKAPL